MRDAIYKLSIEVTFAGNPPNEKNMAAPEILPIQYLCVEQIRDTLKKAGYELIQTGHGARRLETTYD